jgi:NAD-dependent DNA ligase
MSFSIPELLENPEDYTKKVSIILLELFIRKANKFYYETEQQLVPDAVYDIALDNLRLRSPDNPILTEIGFTPCDVKVKLPYHMGSMSKIKNTEAITNWLSKYEGPFVISDKLDGASAILEYKNNKRTLFSRGNGIFGRDISHLLKYMTLPKLQKDIALRGELIISKANFNGHRDKYSNSRSMVVGLMGKKTQVPELIALIEFVVFEIIHDKLNSYQQLQLAGKYGFPTCNYSLYTKNDLANNGQQSMKNSFLLKTLLEYRVNASYDIDGIIITDNNIHPRNITGNPEYSMAFKANGIGHIVKVIDVDWNISKHGKIVPRVEIEPVVIDGVRIQFATGYHAKFIVDNMVGSESLVRIVRSGDVIPSIIEVIKKSTTPIMPTGIEYVWNETKVNIFITNPDTNTAYTHQQILHFFRTMGVENMSVGLIKKLINGGYNTIAKIYYITRDELLALEGFQEKLSDKIHTNIRVAVDKPQPLELVMAASLKFGIGFGIRRLLAITHRYPDIHLSSIPPHTLIDTIKEIEGFSSITASQFIDNLPAFNQFMVEHPFIKIAEKKNKLKIVSDRFSGKKVLLTGFRDAKIVDYIEKHNGTMATTISKKIYLLIVKDDYTTGVKIEKAKQFGIPIITQDTFINEYF